MRVIGLRKMVELTKSQEVLAFILDRFLKLAVPCPYNAPKTDIKRPLVSYSYWFNLVR